MTFLQALYGSQYSEIAQSGKDGNKGRLNGNLFLSAMVILALFVVVSLLMHLSAAFAADSNSFFHSLAGNKSGRTTGRLLAIPLMGVIYLVVSRTVGSEENFKKQVDGYMNCPEAEKQQANKRLLMPFFGLLLVLFILLVI